MMTVEATRATTTVSVWIAIDENEDYVAMDERDDMADRIQEAGLLPYYRLVKLDVELTAPSSVEDLPATTIFIADDAGQIVTARPAEHEE